MEENQTQAEIAQAGPVQSTGFTPSSSANKSSSAKWLVIFILLLALGGGGVYYFATSGSAPVATPTPSFGVVPIDDSNEDDDLEATATPTPAVVDKSEIVIDIQNGTGVPGEAAFVQTKMKALGFSDIKVGNASSTDNTDTTVSVLRTLAQSVQDEIKKELERSYKTVVLKTVTSQTADVVIVTGTRTSSASSSATPSATATSKSTPKASPTSTPPSAITN